MIDVLQLQTDLLSLGIDPGPLDGRMGSRTRGAAHTAAQRLGLTDFTGGAIPPELVAGIHTQTEARRQPPPAPAGFLDVSEDAAAGWREGYRPLSQVVGVTFHQTGCPMPDVSDAEFAYYQANHEFSRKDTPALLRWAKHQISKPGEPVKSVSLKTHFGIPYSGKILQIHPLDVWGWSAQRASRKTFSIEIGGFFEGIFGDPTTRPGGPASWKTQTPTPAQIEAAKNLVRWLYAYFKKLGLTLKFVFGHRQFTNDRTPDPGDVVWRLIVLPLCAELGMTDGGEGYVEGKGQKIPYDWNPAYSAGY